MRTRLSLVAAVAAASVLTATGTTLPAPAVKLVVSPSDVLLDQPVRVRVRGLPAE